MDTEQLIKDTKARYKHNSAKQYLKDKYQSKLTIASQGGLWKITPELLTFLATSTTNTFVLLDAYENPIKVNCTDLLIKVTTVYNDVMTEWHNEYTQLQNNR